MRKIAVIDDDPSFLSIVEHMLAAIGHEAVCFDDPTRFLRSAGADIDLVICDLNMPQMSGFDVLANLKKESFDFPVIVSSVQSEIETASLATQKGALDFLQKPFRIERLETTLNNVFRTLDLQRTHKALKEQLESSGEEQGLIGRSAAIAAIRNVVGQLKATRPSILITGESGTGKEIVARQIHRSTMSPKAPFVAINCGAIPEDLLESELFGHAKGSFSGATTERKGLFEEAHGGTLFLDEIGDLPAKLQVKLLRALQEGEIRPVGKNKTIKVDIRVIAATHRNIKKLMKQEKFREDLYFRLAVFPIHIPPLRERKEDIPILARRFADKACAKYDVTTRLAPDAMRALMNWSWPGNVRELENFIERAVVTSTGAEIGVKGLPPFDDDASPDVSQIDEQTTHFKRDPSQLYDLKRMEKTYIEHVLQVTKGDKQVAARILGVNWRTLYRKIQALKIESRAAKLNAAP